MIIPLNLNLQVSSDQVREIVTTNDATVQGILIGIVLALSTIVVFLYRKTETMQKEYIKELKAINEMVLKINNDQKEFTANLLKFQEYVRKQD